MGVTHLAAVAVDAEAHVVEEAVALALDLHEEETLDIGANRKGLGVEGLVQVAEEIVARTAGGVQDILSDMHAVGVVDEAVQGSVTTEQDGEYCF